MRYPSIASGAATAGRWSVIALGFSIPISVALDNVLLAITALVWLTAGNYRDKLALIRANPVALAAFALFGLLVLGLGYGVRNPGDGLHYLGKYADLLFVPVFLTLFRDQQTRELGLKAFGGAMILSLIMSHLVYHDLLFHNPVLPRLQEIPGGFKYSITHSLLACFTAFLFALLAREETRRGWRVAYILIALVAAHNVLFIVLSRTGYLVLAVLLLYFFVVTFGRRGLAVATLLGTGLFVSAYFGSETFHARTNVAASQFEEWRLGEPSKDSVGLRLEWYTTSLKLVREDPLIGSGTGSFPAAYARAVEGQNMVATDNPHNEYLMISVQIGLLGLACLLHLFWRQWQFADRLVQPLYRDLGRGLMLTFVIGSLFNSLLLDHTEGLLFAWMSALVFAAPVKPASSPAS